MTLPRKNTKHSHLKLMNGVTAKAITNLAVNFLASVDLRTGQGENHLGRILMKVREELAGSGQERN